MKKIGVIVGRFQTPELYSGHKAIIEYALKAYEKVYLILGVQATRATKRNPLDFEARKRMMEEAYPSKFEQILYIQDKNSNVKWSDYLDSLIEYTIPKNETPTLIGTKNGLLSKYTGKFQVEVRESLEIFNSSSEKIVKDLQYRKGVVAACSSRYPTVYPTVDCAIFEDESFQVLWLARKKDEDLFRFVGGFADPEDDGFEASALREAKEETGMDCEIVDWIGSCKIDDWRYREEEDKIITNLFALKRVFGKVLAQDDIFQLKAVSIDLFSEENIQPEHRKLFRMVKHWAKTNRGRK